MPAGLHLRCCADPHRSLWRRAGAVRTDDLGAVPLQGAAAAQSQGRLARLDDVYFGCANQAGEDNRNVARMAVLLAGLPTSVPASTVNRLCGSSLDATLRPRAAIKPASASS